MLRLPIILLAGLLAAPAAPAADVYQDNVVILLDGSGSMNGPMQGQTKIKAATQAIAAVLDSLPEETQVGLLVFTGKSAKQGWVFPLGPRNDPGLKKAMQEIVPSGGTPLGRYIQLAADRLIEQRMEQLGYGSYRLLVVTDGAASDKNFMQRIAPMVVAKGLRMDVIGVDMKSTHMLARNAHSYRAANDAASLQEAIAEVLGEVSAGNGGAAEADFELLEGLPDELALAAVSTLASPSNLTIAESLRKPRPAVQLKPAPAPAKKPRVSPPGHPQAAAPSRPTGMLILSPLFLVAIFLFGSIVFIVLKNR